MSRVCVVIPVYNHPDALSVLIARLESFGLDTLLVNDGSEPGCSAVMRELTQANDWLYLLEREGNGGKGAAVKTGLLEAHRLGYQYALQIDADGQHDLADISTLLRLSRRYPEAVISGMPDYHNVPRIRFYGRYLTHIWVWINTLSLDIRDSMCGFRLYPLESTVRVLRSSYTGDRMDFDPEILVRLYWEGVEIKQFSTRVSYPLDGISHFRSVLDNALISWMHTRLFFGMICRSPHLLARKWLRRD